MGTGIILRRYRDGYHEAKKAGDEFLFLERVGNWLEEILGKKVTISVSE